MVYVCLVAVPLPFTPPFFLSSIANFSYFHIFSLGSTKGKLVFAREPRITFCSVLGPLTYRPHYGISP